MTAHEIADSRDDYVQETNAPRSRRSRLLRLALIGLMLVFVLGNQSNCDHRRAPTIECRDFRLEVAPGNCVQFQNPCDPGQWEGPPRYDGFRFCDAPPGVSVRTTRTGSEVRRVLCVSSDAPFLYDQSIMFIYGRGTEDGEGNLILTTATQLAVEMMAWPSTVAFGESAQLFAVASGGISPYTYLWEPAETLDDPSRLNPIASPASTTTYTVTVTDAVGQTASGTVTVSVNPPAPSLTADFSYTVLCCPTLNLNATASTGNIVSYTWDLSWTAADPDQVTSSPTTSFAIREIDRGTIRLTVADAAGHTAAVTKNFP